MAPLAGCTHRRAPLPPPGPPTRVVQTMIAKTFCTYSTNILRHEKYFRDNGAAWLCVTGVACRGRARRAARPTAGQGGGMTECCRLVLTRSGLATNVRD